MATWANISQSSAPSWTNTNVESEFDGGQPIGLLLSLTFAGITVSNSWSPISQNSAPTWANITEN